MLSRTRNGNPRMRLTTDIYDYWLERADLTISELEAEGFEREHVEKNSLRYRGDTIFHYGSHFPLAEIVRDRRGRTRMILLNGDIYGGIPGFGPSTGTRQGEIRAAVERTDHDSIILPFSTLSAAGIDRQSVKPIHVREDRHTIHERASDKRPADLTSMDDPSGATVIEPRWDYSESPPRKFDATVPKRVPNPRRTVSFRSGHGWCDEGAKLGDDGRWHWVERRHWLGDSIFRARIVETRRRKLAAEEAAERDAWRAWHAQTEQAQAAIRSARERLDNAKDGRYEWDTQERNYYLAVPPQSAEEVERLTLEFQAMLDAMSELDEQAPPYPHVTNGNSMSYTVTRWATFLSSFDYQEARPLYFLCELPYGAKPTTVEQAIDMLKPPEVIAAEARGLKVIRQGDLFAIPTKLTKRQLRKMRGRRDFTKRLRVLGTNHSVTEGIVCAGGATLGRGIMRHEPDGRRGPDHARQSLGKAWHLLVRNTVPRTR